MNKRIKALSLMVISILMIFVLPGFSKPNGVSIKTGIIGAMDEEIDSLKSAVKNAKATSIGNMEFCEGSLDVVDVVIVNAVSERLMQGLALSFLSISLVWIALSIPG